MVSDDKNTSKRAGEKLFKDEKEDGQKNLKNIEMQTIINKQKKD